MSKEPMENGPLNGDELPERSALTNVDKYEIAKDPDNGDVVMKFMDHFDWGMAVGLPPEDARRFCDALDRHLRERGA